MKKVFLIFGFPIIIGVATIICVSCGKGNSRNVVGVPENGVLINGVVWAKTNIAAPGTFAAKPEEAGMIYQWNRKVGWSAADPLVSSNGDTNWDCDEPIGDVWEKANDPSPVGWRIPTLDEIKTLLDTDKVKTEWINGGTNFIDRISGNSIFLPAAGYRFPCGGSFNDAGRLIQPGFWGEYWSSTDAYGMCFYKVRFNNGWKSYFRGSGRPIRCVAE